ncbi:hypothetical protein B0H34DRAFT_793029 [Crassisporium funariophilum]|nr:hypothetical protein B0H34DRAFT_793029 [Crassisporium funariophilum]
MSKQKRSKINRMNNLKKSWKEETPLSPKKAKAPLSQTPKTPERSTASSSKPQYYDDESNGEPIPNSFKNMHYAFQIDGLFLPVKGAPA